MTTPKIARRSVLAGLGAALIARPALPTPGEARELRLYNVNTGESFRDAYFNGEGYVASALPRLNWFLRDHREAAAAEVDPHLFDILWNVQLNYLRFHGAHVVLNVHSAYRTERTNAMLRNEGAAQNSYHKLGRAIDISAQGYGIYFLYDMVQNCGAGGTGVYMRSQFAHVDTGPRRSWIQPLW
ncbi:MAG: DUF882 domain-containing protein [Rhodospirillaceae bacterium]|nr:DUF882 domain-containing protein [Rhodospirillaceae bacterium]